MTTPVSSVGQARDDLTQTVDLIAYLLDQALYGGHDGHYRSSAVASAVNGGYSGHAT